MGDLEKLSRILLSRVVSAIFTGIERFLKICSLLLAESKREGGSKTVLNPSNCSHNFLIILYSAVGK